jgi:phosphohistidine phosphatase
MKTVYLLRHAKSDWADPGMKDHDRPLNERGREAALAMAAYITEKGYKPELVLCSSARRTIETFDLVKAALGKHVPVKFEEGLYLAEPRHLLERLRLLHNDVKAVMIIGHNPGVAQFANELCASPDDEAEEKLHRRMREKFATCALAVIAVPVKTWRDLRAGGGALKDFVRPKDL